VVEWVVVRESKRDLSQIDVHKKPAGSEIASSEVRNEEEAIGGIGDGSKEGGCGGRDRGTEWVIVCDGRDGCCNRKTSNR
jgi:hypothetical protein